MGTKQGLPKEKSGRGNHDSRPQGKKPKEWKQFFEREEYNLCPDY